MDTATAAAEIKEQAASLWTWVAEMFGEEGPEMADLLPIVERLDEIAGKLVQQDGLAD